VIRAIGRVLVLVINALIIAYWWLLALTLIAAFVGGFIAMVGAFGGWQETKLFGGALLKFGGMGFFFVIVLGSMGAPTDPIRLNKPAQLNAVATVQKEKE
jgi:hypothetical protein